MVKFFEKYRWRSAIFSKVALTLSNFELMLRNFKYFITALINAEEPVL